MNSTAELRPRVVLLTSPSLYGAVIINQLAAEPGIELVGVGLTDRVYKGKGLLGTLRTIVRRTGWRYTFYNILAANVGWTILRLKGRPKGLRPLGANVKMLKDVNSAETLEWLKGLRPDYVASFYFNQWIGKGVRAIPSQGCINVHPSLLPALRGPDPLFRTLERGLTTTGLTIHIVDDGFDAGQVLHQEACYVPEKISLFGLYLLVVKTGAQLLASWLAGRIQRPAVTAPAVVPDNTAPAIDDYTTFPAPSEVAQFVKNGKRLIGRGELSRAIREVE